MIASASGEYLVLCYGLDPQPEHVIDADVTVRGWLKASRTVIALLTETSAETLEKTSHPPRTLTEDAGLPAESRLRSVAHLRHLAFGRFSAGHAKVAEIVGSEQFWT